MIVEAEIISQPYSGEYKERIYDNQSAWNSQSWTWIKFINEDSTEWCGQFRGFPKQVAISEKLNCILVLTSDYLFQLDRSNGNLLELEDHPNYQNLAVTPLGEFVVADYYHLERIKDILSQKEPIKSPVQMDMIQFKGWTGNKLNFTCDEFLNWDKHLEMELDGETFEITIKNAT